MISPKHIEVAVSNNCNINTHASKKLMGGLNDEDVQTPRIMFVGLCDQHWISKEDIGDFLCIQPAQIELKLRQFYSLLEEGAIHKKRKGKMDGYDPSDQDAFRFFIQYCLCQKYLLTCFKGFANISHISKQAH